MRPYLSKHNKQDDAELKVRKIVKLCVLNAAWLTLLMIGMLIRTANTFSFNHHS